MENKSVSQGTPALSGGKRLLLVISAMLLMAGFSASGYGNSVLLPTYLTSMNAMQYYSLVSATSTLSMMLAMPLVGKLSAKFGLKRVVIFGVLGQFAARCLMIGSTNFVIFVALYAFSQFAGGLYLTAPYVMIAEVTPRDQVAKYFSIATAVNAVGALLGPVMSGLVLDGGNMGLAFIAYVPFMIVALPIIITLYTNRVAPRTGSRFDLLGIILLVVAMGCITYWLCLAGSFFPRLSAPSIILLVVGIVCLVWLFKRELKHENPSIPVGFFRKKRFRSVFIAIAFINAFSTCVTAYALAYAQHVLKVSATVSGTVTMPMTIARLVCGMLLAGIMAKNFTKRFGPVNSVSALLLVIGAVCLVVMKPVHGLIPIYIASVLGGIGSVASQSTFAAFYQSELQPAEFSGAQGIFNVASSLGPLVFVAISGALMNVVPGFTGPFVLNLVFCILATIVCVVAVRFPKEVPTAQE